MTSDSSEEVPETFPLSAHFALLASKLLDTADRSDSSSGNLRNAAFEAFMDMVKYSPGVRYVAGSGCGVSLGCLQWVWCVTWLPEGGVVCRLVACSWWGIPHKHLEFEASA